MLHDLSSTQQDFGHSIGNFQLKVKQFFEHLNKFVINKAFRSILVLVTYKFADSFQNDPLGIFTILPYVNETDT